MADLGSDLSLGPQSDGTLDLESDLATVDGEPALLEAIARRLSARGLFYDPSYGIDLVQYIGSAVPLDVITQAAELECLRDERVRTAQWVASKDETTGTISGPLSLDTDLGPYQLTLAVGAAIGVVLAETIPQPQPGRLILTTENP